MNGEENSTPRLALGQTMMKLRAGLFCVLIATATEAYGQIEPGSLVDLAITPAPTTLVGANGGNRLGSAFASGDFDGDGELDLAILASSTTAVDTLPPFIVILFGCGSLYGLVDLASYAGPVGIIKAIPGDAGTWATIVTGNFNSDSADDLAFAIPSNTQATNYDGKVYMLFGSPLLVGATVLLQSPTVPITTLYPAAGSSGWLGMAMASGDLNYAGEDELLVAAPFHAPGGRVYVVPGQPAFPPTIQLATAPNVSRISETGINQACGIGLDCADFDADGFDDILIGSPGDGLANSSGVVSLMLGTSVLPGTVLLSSATPGVTRFYDEYENGGLGWTVALADMDGDGRRDAVMGALVADPLGCDDCGEVYVVYSSASLPDSLHMGSSVVPMTRFLGAGHSLHYGVSMAAGRINADLCADLVLKREPDDFVPMDRRSVVIAYGSAMRPDTVFLNTDPAVTRVLAEQPGDDLGVGLAVFDLDGDGLGEALLGAPFANALGRTRAGKVHVFPGFAMTTAVTPAANDLAVRAYPNPFGTSTVLQLTAPDGERGALSIFNVRGQRVLHIDGLSFRHTPVEYAWNGVDQVGRELPSGVYFCRLQVGPAQQALKLIVLR